MRSEIRWGQKGVAGSFYITSVVAYIIYTNLDLDLCGVRSLCHLGPRTERYKVIILFGLFGLLSTP